MTPLRRTATRAALVGVLLSVAACGEYGTALKARQAVARFEADATDEERVAARNACLTFPHVTPEPVATDSLSVRTKTDIRYRVDDATDNELAQLYACLHKQPKIRTVETRPLGG